MDLCYHNFDCKSVSDACRANYVAKNCNCFNGDFIKLWYRMLRIEGSGITGLFIMMMIYIGTSVLSALILYEYLVHIHRDGRILDIWRRINAPAEEFFMPHDYEVSREELSSIISKAAAWKGVGGAKRKLIVEDGVERDQDDPNYLGRVRRYIINEVEASGRTSVYRQFVMDNSGMILEIFEDFKRADRRQHLFGHDDEHENNSNGNALALAHGEEEEEDHLIRDSPRVEVSPLSKSEGKTNERGGGREIGRGASPRGDDGALIMM